jgi:hypothetical protein
LRWFPPDQAGGFNQVETLIDFTADPGSEQINDRTLIAVPSIAPAVWFHVRAWACTPICQGFWLFSPGGSATDGSPYPPLKRKLPLNAPPSIRTQASTTKPEATPTLAKAEQIYNAGGRLDHKFTW